MSSAHHDLCRRGFLRISAATCAALLVGCGSDDDGAGNGASDGANDAGGSADAGACTPDTSPRCAGAPAPTYALEDVQPQSDRFGETYGLDGFEGRVTVVALVASWCSFCQSQVQQLEGMSLDLRLTDHRVNMVAVNQTGAEDTVDNFIERCSFPILQDVASVDAWGAHDAKKDDIAIYGPDGVLVEFIRVSELPADIRTLASDAGYDWMRERIVAAVEA